MPYLAIRAKLSPNRASFGERIAFGDYILPSLAMERPRWEINYRGPSPFALKRMALAFGAARWRCSKAATQ